MGGSWLLWGRAYSFCFFLSLSASISPSVTSGRDSGDMTSYDQGWLFILLSYGIMVKGGFDRGRYYLGGGFLVIRTSGARGHRFNLPPEPINTHLSTLPQDC